jgi:hypothetical protein
MMTAVSQTINDPHHRQYARHKGCAILAQATLLSPTAVGPGPSQFARREHHPQPAAHAQGPASRPAIGHRGNGPRGHASRTGVARGGGAGERRGAGETEVGLALQ